MYRIRAAELHAEQHERDRRLAALELVDGRNLGCRRGRQSGQLHPAKRRPTDNTGSCDPDGDGVQGVDYDNNPATGVNGQETTWRDIAGNLVDCSTSGNPGQTIDIGAIQNATSGGGGNPPSGTVTGVQRNDDH